MRNVLDGSCSPNPTISCAEAIICSAEVREIRLLLRPLCMFMKGSMNKILILGALLVAFTGLSHAETISPRRLLETADLADPVVSPDGRSVAFRLEQASVERNTYDTTWYVQALDGKSPPLHVADGGVPLRGTAGLSLPATVVW